MHVYAYPAGGAPPCFFGFAGLGGGRPDVGGIFAPGQSKRIRASRHQPDRSDWTLAIFPHSTVTGAFSDAVTRNITVVSRPGDDRRFAGETTRWSISRS